MLTRLKERYRFPLVLAGLVVCFLTAGCAERTQEPALIRLVSLLPTAEIESPLIHLPAVDSVDDLESVEIEEVWRDDFESPDRRFSEMQGCVRIRETDGDRGFVLACENGGHCRASVPVSAGMRYRVRLLARWLQGWGCAVTVTEWSRDAPLRIFRFPTFEESWQSYEIWFHSAPEADRVVIEIEPGYTEGRLWLDDLVVERLDLDADQELRLLKARHNVDVPEPHLGMIKRGRLLPIPDPELVDSPLSGNYGIRDTMFAPAPTAIRFGLDIPRSARLNLAYALSRESIPGDAARFRVLASDGQQEPLILLDEPVSLSMDDSGWHWREREISLDSLGGRRVWLTLETRGLGENQHALALWGNPVIYQPRRSGEAPNVILIAVDTLRADRLSCYGYTPGITPQIDSLAADGVRFEQAIASANWTLPSFLSLFTGRGGLDLRGDLRDAPETTLAEHFQAAGWSTAAILYKSSLYDKGFDRGFDFFLNAPRGRIRAEDNLKTALDWLWKNGRRRFFLFLHFDDPHQPFCQPAARLGEESHLRLEQFGLKLPILVSDRDAATLDWSHPTLYNERRRCTNCLERGVLTPAFKDLAKDLYDDSVSYADERIGRFLSALKEEGLYDESVIAFVSDHGETLWTHGEQYGHGEDNLHDELVRVPMIIKPALGAEWARGRTVSSQVRLFDLMPTLLDLAGLETDHLTMEARSLLSALRAEGDYDLQERPAFSAADKFAFSLRNAGFKYIRRFSGGSGGERSIAEEVLYDLTADPGETNNVAPGQPLILKRMRLAMEELLDSTSSTEVLAQEDPNRKSIEPVDARQLEVLKALGYVETDKVGNHILVEAETFRDGNLNPDSNPFGDGIVIDGGTHPAWAEYDVVVPQTGIYRIEARYAAEDVRPMEVLVDGRLVAVSFREVTGGWYPEHQQWVEVVTVELQAGGHVFRIESSGLIPHLDKFRLRLINEEKARQ